MDSNNFVIIDVEGQNYQKLDDKKSATKKESAKKVAVKKVVNKEIVAPPKVVNKEIVASKKVNKRTNTDIPSYNMNRNDLVYLFIGTNIFSFGMGIFSYYLFE
tara:strand:- start:356 stop:664 length:309 start_codon:yes stop_codon:yes gene_type:complete